MSGQVVGIVGTKAEAGVAERFRQRCGSRGDHGQPASHRFDDR
jgi:hypothetical protein